jgi:apolipoprotein N-acyltransferase
MTKKNTLLASLSGILFALAWSHYISALLILVAFVPLLLVENNIKELKDAQRKMTLYATITFSIWNSLTIWWIYNATLGGAITAVIVQSFVMLLAFYGYFWLRRKSNFQVSAYTLIIWWLAFEFAYLRTEISFPWLHLGNAFGTVAPLVQWYEYTGILGGSLLVLFVNISLAKIMIAYNENRVTLRTKYQTLVTVLIPLGLFTYSYVVYATYQDKGNAIEVVVVQPNIDPYNEKFSGLSDRQQLERFLNLATKKVTPNTKLIVGPETAITEYMWENNLSTQMSSQLIYNYLQDKPNTAILIGASTRKIYTVGEEISHTARRFRDTAIYYDRYNTGLLYDTSGIQIHHKSKLVVGVEKMPYPQYMKFLDNISIDLGGTVGSLGTQEIPTVFRYGKIVAAPVICFESIYGDYVTEYIRQGANIITIITNDGWWGNTPGYKQHLTYARLRAIETRRSIARSANTGISCFINQRGDVLQPTKWWVPDVIVDKVHLNNQRSFYSIHGDSIGRIAGVFWILLLLYGVSLYIKTLGKNKFSKRFPASEDVYSGD